MPGGAKDIVIRRLQISDYDKGFPAILKELTVVGDISRERFEQRFALNEKNENHVTLVGEDTVDGKIVCTGSLIFESKYIRECGIVGHIEDVAVDSSYRGLRLGARYALIKRFVYCSPNCGGA